MDASIPAPMLLVALSARVIVATSSHLMLSPVKVYIHTQSQVSQLTLP